jgi:hypothetical protein
MRDLHTIQIQDKLARELFNIKKEDDTIKAIDELISYCRHANIGSEDVFEKTITGHDLLNHMVTHGIIPMSLYIQVLPLVLDNTLEYKINLL